MVGLSHCQSLFFSKQTLLGKDWNNYHDLMADKQKKRPGLCVSLNLSQLYKAVISTKHPLFYILKPTSKTYSKFTDLPLWMSFSGLTAVDRPNNGFPVGNSIVAGKSHGNDGSRAHESSQAWEEELSVLVCIEVIALLWTQLQLPLLPQE